jgi:hypothetical protein
VLRGWLGPLAIALSTALLAFTVGLAVFGIENHVLWLGSLGAVD